MTDRDASLSTWSELSPLQEGVWFVQTVTRVMPPQCTVHIQKKNIARYHAADTESHY